jgi:hypothetical protein
MRTKENCDRYTRDDVVEIVRARTADVPMRNGIALDYEVDPKKRKQASEEQRNPVRRRSADRGALKVGHHKYGKPMLAVKAGALLNRGPIVTIDLHFALGAPAPISIDSCVRYDLLWSTRGPGLKRRGTQRGTNVRTHPYRIRLVTRGAVPRSGH